MYIDKNNPKKNTFANKWGLTSLAQAGHEVILLCGGESKKRQEYFWNSIKVIEIPNYFQINNTTRILKGFFKELDDLKPDIIHSHHYASFVPELSLLYGKIHKIPVCLTFHNTFVEGDFIRKNLGRIYLLGMQFTLPFFDRIFFISNYVNNKNSFKIIPKSKKKVIYNHIKAPPKINLKRERETILYIGRLTHQKGVDLLLKAVHKVKRRIPNITLNIVGKGERNYVKKLRKITRSLNLEDNVHFLGIKKGGEKWKLFYKSQALIIPSRDEGFGNIVIEGQLCKLPLLISNKGSLREASGRNALIFPINNNRIFAKKIIRILNDKGLRKELIKKGMVHAKKFTHNTIAQELEKEYNLIILKN